MSSIEERIQNRKDVISAKIAHKRSMKGRVWIDGGLNTEIISSTQMNMEHTHISVDIIIPFYGSIDERQENLKCVVEYINNISPQHNIIVVEQGCESESFISALPVKYLSLSIDDNLFHKSEILNYAMSNSFNDVVMMLDSDMIIDSGVIENIPCYAERGYLTMPFYNICYTTKEQKIQILQNNNYLFNPNNEVMNIPTRKDVGGCNIFFRDDYIAVGEWDECFIGWGAEDTAFATKFQNKLNGVRHVDILGIHLYHKPSNQNPEYRSNLKHLNLITNSTKTPTNTSIGELAPIWFPSYFGERANLNHYSIKSLESIISNNSNRNIIIITNQPELFPDDSRITKIHPFGLEEFKSQSHGASITHWLKSWMPSKYLSGTNSFYHIDNDTYWIGDPAPISKTKFVASLWDYGNLNNTPDIHYSNSIAGRKIELMEYKWLSSGSGELPVLNMTDVIDACQLSVNTRELLKNTKHRNDGDEIAYYKHYTKNQSLWSTNYGYCKTHEMGIAGIHFGGNLKQESMDLFLKNKK